MSLGPTELLLILGIALLMFGPSRLPGLGRSMGDAIRGFKKGLEGDEEDMKNVGPSSQIKEGSTTASEKQTENEKSKV